MSSFIIMQDYIEDGDDDAVGIGFNYPCDCRECVERGEIFYLIDDDGITYYQGRGWGDYEDDAWQWGAWYAGTTVLADAKKRVVIG